ncbi:MAG: GHKL domain-containing protein [Bacteroidetes bacterium]|nr:GHKL domain-containing protein [Bacteroidota bacterium]
MKKRNWVALILMTTSLVLLISLQVVWLRSRYKDVKRDLRREVSMLFTSTLMAMQDSVLEKNIKPLPGDSTAEIFGNIAAARDTIRFNGHDRAELGKPTQDKVIYFSGVQPDSMRKFFRPLMMKLRTSRKQRGYVMQITLDSLKPDDIKRNYGITLAKSTLYLPFTIEKTKNHNRHQEETADIVTEPFPFFQRGSFYVARFSEITFFLLKKLLPQLLFSMFLTLLTGTAFYLMYRSILSNQRLLEIKNDFISNMTHELKTPIATVSVALESLKDFNALGDEQRTKEYIDIARHELNRLSILTDKVLKTAVFESNGLAFNTERIQLDEIVRNVLDSMKLVFEKHQRKVMLKTEGNNFELNGNADHLTNVVYNLLDNALKYSSAGSDVEIELRTSDTEINLSVRDHGVGIAPEHQKRIFEKFYRVPTGDVANVKGHGLGLSYVDSVVKRHRGEVKVESELGRGTAFIITLPKSA